MWIKYNRILQGNQWIHPDFANDGRTTEKYLSPTDNTLFLANTNVMDFTGYENFNVAEVTDINSEKRNFGLTTMLTKLGFLERFTDQEKYIFLNYEPFIDAMPIDIVEKQKRKATMFVIVESLKLADAINLDYKNATDYYNKFLSVGLISEARLKEILGL